MTPLILAVIGFLPLVGWAARFVTSLIRSQSADGTSTASPTTVGIALLLLSARLRISGGAG